MGTPAEPSELAAALERSAPMPAGTEDRFLGYSVMGLPFGSGDVLALRRFPATSLGPAYTSVWHRDPGGRWVFYSDVAAAHGCAAYWREAIDRTVVAPIRLEWSAPRQLTVSVDNGRLITWSMTLRDTPLTAMLTAASRLVPPSWWAHGPFVDALSRCAGLALRAGRLTLRAHTPSGHEFVAVPHAIRVVDSSRATVLGRDLGAPRPVRPRATLGEFAVPQRGIFATGLVTMRDVRR